MQAVLKSGSADQAATGRSIDRVLCIALSAFSRSSVLHLNALQLAQRTLVPS
jgi:hypothetical protein